MSLEAEACANCLFYMESPKVCRRFPPLPLMLGAKQGLAGPEPMVQSFFPNMAPTGWCGEWKPLDDAEMVQN